MDGMDKETVALAFMCFSGEFVCGGPQGKVWCKEFTSFSVTSSSGDLPGDLPEKDDCIYGDTASLTSYSTTASLNFWEILSLTGYQPQGEYIKDSSRD